MENALYKYLFIIITIIIIIIMSTIWSVYGMNYAQNSILNGLRGAWNVCRKHQQTLVSQIFLN